MATARPTFPLISARGSNKKGDAGGMISARSHHTQRSHGPASALNPDRFTKLKAVLVNNLLKLYHKKMGRAGDNVVYQRAVEEVDQILRDGKMTEKQMRDLQKKFADTFTEPTAFGGTPSAGLTAQPSSGGLQPRPPDAPRPEGQGPTSQANRGPGAPSMPGTAGSPSKRRRHVDEWSVIVLQKDAEHLQKDRQDKQKLAAKKVDTRNELNEQIEVRRKAKEAFKAEERKQADEAKNKHDEWEREKKAQDKRRQDNITADRSIQEHQLLHVQEMRKHEAERALAEEQATIADYKRQLDDDRRAHQHKKDQKQAQYQQVLVENEANLERKRVAKQKARADDERLYQVQLDMAAKQEERRAGVEAERLRRLEMAERVGGGQVSRAAQMEAQIEDRIRRAQEERAQRELDKEREKRERKKKEDAETHTTLQKQILLKKEKQAVLKDADRRLADRLKKDAEAFESDKVSKKQAEKAAAQKRRLVLDVQAQDQAMAKLDLDSMTNVELRLNKGVLMNPDVKLSADLAERLNQANRFPLAQPKNVF